MVAGGYGNDGRVIAGVATGVGFIGAGMIFHDSTRGVVGFATAAASWSVVAIGVLAGVGRGIVALAITGIALAVLEFQYIGVTPLGREPHVAAPPRQRLRPGSRERARRLTRDCPRLRSAHVRELHDLGLRRRDVALGEEEPPVDTEPLGRPSVSSQLGTPGSSCASTIRQLPSGSSVVLERLRPHAPVHVVVGLQEAVPERDVGERDTRASGR